MNKSIGFSAPPAIVAMLLAVLLLPVVNAMAVDVNWNVISGDVSVPGNWTPSAPVAGDTAYIANDGTATIGTGNTFGVTLGGLYLGNKTSVVGNYGNVTQTGGAVDLSGVMYVGYLDDSGNTSLYDMQGGTITSTANVYVGSGASAKGKLQMSGGSSTAAGPSLSTSGRIYIGDTVGTGTVEMSGYTNLASTGNTLYVGVGAAGTTGTLSMSDHANLSLGTSTSYSYIGASGGKGTMTMDGNSTATINSARFYVSANAGTVGELTLQGHAQMTVNSSLFRVGSTGGSTSQTAKGTVTVKGGTSESDRGAKLTANLGLNVGIFQYGEGYLNIEEYGDLYMPANRTLVVGDMYQTDYAHGSLTVKDHGRIDVGYLTIGNLAYGIGVGELKDSAVATVRNTVTLGNSGNGTLTLGSGTVLNTSKVALGSGTGTGTLNFNGGTLKALANENSFVVAGGVAGNCVVQSGGAIIDTNGFNVVVRPALAGDTVLTGGGLTKNGAGQLVLSRGAHTYTGATTLNEGTLVAYTTPGYTLGPMTVKQDAMLTVGVWDEGLNVIFADQTSGAADLKTSSLTFEDGAKMTTVLLDQFGGIGGVTTLTTGALAASATSAAVEVAFTGATPTAAAGPYDLVTYASNSGVTFLPHVDAIGTMGVTIADNGTNKVQIAFADIDTHWTSGGANQDYTTTANWSSYVPNGNNKRALIDGTGETINLNANVTLSSLTLNPTTGGFNLAAVGANKLTMDSTLAINALINNAAGSNTIGAPITLNKNTDVAVVQGADTLTISGAISGDKGIAKTGAGTLLLAGAGSTFSGPIAVSTGTLAIADGGAMGAGSGAAADLVLAGGTTLKYTGSTATGTSRGMTANGAVTLQADSAEGVLSVNGAVASNGGVLTKLGAGTVKFASPAGTQVLTTGRVNATGGTLELGGTNGAAYAIGERLYIGAGQGNTGAVVLSGDSVTNVADRVYVAYGASAEADPPSTAVSTGSLTMTDSAQLNVGGNTTLGIWNYSDGSLTMSGSSVFNANGGMVCGDNSVGSVTTPAPGDSSIDMSGDATLNVTGSLILAQFTQGRCTVDLTDNATVNTTGNAYFGQRGAQVTVNLNTPANPGDHVNVNIGGQLYVGYNGYAAVAEPASPEVLSQATLNVADGTSINATGSIWFGHTYGHADVNMTGGSITSGGSIAVARTGTNSTATLTMSGDSSIATTGTGWIGIGNGYGGGGVGVATLSDNASISCNDWFFLAYGGVGTLTIGDGDAPTGGDPGALVHVGGNLMLGNSANGDGQATINLKTGGTLETPYIWTDGAVSSIINFDGGVLKVLADDTVDRPFISNTGLNSSGTASQASTTFALNVLDEGATIDTNGFNATIVEALVEDPASTGGGLTKKGAGKLTLTGDNTYSGDTIVQAGTLSIDAAMLYDDADLSLAVGSVMDLNFAGTDEIAGLLFGNSAQALGTWGATGSGAAHIDDTYFTGTGMLLVTEMPITVIIPGDTNGDLIVDATDAGKLAQYWGASVTGGDYTKGDFNGDGKVNAADASILAANWGNHTGEGLGTVPEPSILILLLAGSLVAVLRRQR